MMAASKTAMKKELRKSIRQTLTGVSEAAAASQTSNATNALLAMPEYQAARRISVFLSMPSGEISTSGVVHDALANGKQVFIPYTYRTSKGKEGHPKSIMDMVELKSMEDFKTLAPDNWNIPTPSPDSLVSRANCFGGYGLTEGKNIEAVQHGSGLDLIVMPGMAFDSQFGRLGHGKGFYDYFLSRCHKTSQMPFRVGLGLTEQLLPPADSVPMDESDFRLDALITGDGQLRRATA